MSRSAALIFSADPLAAALLGALVELAGHTPNFPQQHAEQARGALLRVRPRLVLIDCDHEACADGFVGPALMTGARVVLVRSARTESDPRELASRAGLRIIDLPKDHDRLVRTLHELSETNGA